MRKEGCCSLTTFLFFVTILAPQDMAYFYFLPLVRLCDLFAITHKPNRLKKSFLAFASIRETPGYFGSLSNRVFLKLSIRRWRHKKFSIDASGRKWLPLFIIVEFEGNFSKFQLSLTIFSPYFRNKSNMLMQTFPRLELEGKEYLVGKKSPGDQSGKWGADDNWLSALIVAHFSGACFLSRQGLS